MQISVTGRHMEITDAIRDYSHEKVQHALTEFPRVESVHVILDVEKYRHIAEVVIHAPAHIRLEARHESDNMYISIDGAADKAAKQLRKAWDRMQERKTREKLAGAEETGLASEEGAERSV